MQKKLEKIYFHTGKNSNIQKYSTLITFLILAVIEKHSLFTIQNVIDSHSIANIANSQPKDSSFQNKILIIFLYFDKHELFSQGLKKRFETKYH